MGIRGDFSEDIKEWEAREEIAELSTSFTTEKDGGESSSGEGADAFGTSSPFSLFDSEQEEEGEEEGDSNSLSESDFGALLRGLETHAEALKAKSLSTIIPPASLSSTPSSEADGTKEEEAQLLKMVSEEDEEERFKFREPEEEEGESLSSVFNPSMLSAAFRLAEKKMPSFSLQQLVRLQASLCENEAVISNPKFYSSFHRKLQTALRAQMNEMDLFELTTVIWSALKTRCVAPAFAHSCLLCAFRLSTDVRRQRSRGLPGLGESGQAEAGASLLVGLDRLRSVVGGLQGQGGNGKGDKKREAELMLESVFRSLGGALKDQISELSPPQLVAVSSSMRGVLPSLTPFFSAAGLHFSELVEEAKEQMKKEEEVATADAVRRGKGEPLGLSTRQLASFAEALSTAGSGPIERAGGILIGSEGAWEVLSEGGVLQGLDSVFSLYLHHFQAAEREEEDEGRQGMQEHGWHREVVTSFLRQPEDWASLLAAGTKLVRWFDDRSMQRRAALVSRSVLTEDAEEVAAGRRSEEDSMRTVGSLGEEGPVLQGLFLEGMLPRLSWEEEGISDEMLQSVLEEAKAARRKMGEGGEAGGQEEEERFDGEGNGEEWGDPTTMRLTALSGLTSHEMGQLESLKLFRAFASSLDLFASTEAENEEATSSFRTVSSSVLVSVLQSLYKSSFRGRETRLYESWGRELLKRNFAGLTLRQVREVLFLWAWSGVCDETLWEGAVSALQKRRSLLRGFSTGELTEMTEALVKTVGREVVGRDEGKEWEKMAPSVAEISIRRLKEFVEQNGGTQPEEADIKALVNEVWAEHEQMEEDRPKAGANQCEFLEAVLRAVSDRIQELSEKVDAALSPPNAKIELFDGSTKLRVSPRVPGEPVGGGGEDVAAPLIQEIRLLEGALETGRRYLGELMGDEYFDALLDVSSEGSPGGSDGSAADLRGSEENAFDLERGGIAVVDGEGEEGGEARMETDGAAWVPPSELLEEKGERAETEEVERQGMKSGRGDSKVKVAASCLLSLREDGAPGEGGDFFESSASADSGSGCLEGLRTWGALAVCVGALVDELCGGGGPGGIGGEAGPSSSSEKLWRAVRVLVKKAGDLCAEETGEAHGNASDGKAVVLAGVLRLVRVAVEEKDGLEKTGETEMRSSASISLGVLERLLDSDCVSRTSSSSSDRQRDRQSSCLSPLQAVAGFQGAQAGLLVAQADDETLRSSSSSSLASRLFRFARTQLESAREYLSLFRSPSSSVSLAFASEFLLQPLVDLLKTEGPRRSGGTENEKETEVLSEWERLRQEAVLLGGHLVESLKGRGLKGEKEKAEGEELFSLAEDEKRQWEELFRILAVPSSLSEDEAEKIEEGRDQVDHLIRRAHSTLTTASTSLFRVKSNGLFVLHIHPLAVSPSPSPARRSAEALEQITDKRDVRVPFPLSSSSPFSGGPCEDSAEAATSTVDFFVVGGSGSERRNERGASKLVESLLMQQTVPSFLNPARLGGHPEEEKDVALLDGEEEEVADDEDASANKFFSDVERLGCSVLDAETSSWYSRLFASFGSGLVGRDGKEERQKLVWWLKLFGSFLFRMDLDEGTLRAETARLVSQLDSDASLPLQAEAVLSRLLHADAAQAQQRGERPDGGLSNAPFCNAEVLSNLKASSVVSWVKRRMVPRSSVLVVRSPLSTETVRECVETALGNLPPGGDHSISLRKRSDEEMSSRSSDSDMDEEEEERTAAAAAEERDGLGSLQGLAQSLFSGRSSSNLLKVSGEKREGSEAETSEATRDNESARKAGVRVALLASEFADQESVAVSLGVPISREEMVDSHIGGLPGRVVLEVLLQLLSDNRGSLLHSVLSPKIRSGELISFSTATVLPPPGKSRGQWTVSLHAPDVHAAETAARLVLDLIARLAGGGGKGSVKRRVLRRTVRQVLLQRSSVTSSCSAEVPVSGAGGASFPFSLTWDGGEGGEGENRLNEDLGDSVDTEADARRLLKESRAVFQWAMSVSDDDTMRGVADEEDGSGSSHHPASSSAEQEKKKKEREDFTVLSDIKLSSALSLSSKHLLAAAQSLFLVPRTKMESRKPAPPPLALVGLCNAMQQDEVTDRLRGVADAFSARLFPPPAPLQPVTPPASRESEGGTSNLESDAPLHQSTRFLA
uniref:Uncharacterized protein n=1 Tax=Chromera velia CCMP2878 TaxID=1169474 RepID=A0A0G4HRL7_9ALVE|eukprot:Cvel_8093.t1-p1 / transcript=Cvel_8093.t1 / gene=Cvel_8093 / organism=Chromera_velia_CCMP2878 / gene_product=hypothetical protein / transcript_product=hypothetical protein / location=Cvel_scaffold439:60757-81125(-) / protein_length=2142 / sequence_SO=supercontig / SO=protein_coding / is_pseudo=false